MLKFKKLSLKVLTIITLVSTAISFNYMQSSTVTDVNDKDKNEIKTYSSNALIYDELNSIKVVANGKFIEDPNNNNKTLFLSTSGSFVKSKLYRAGAYSTATMFWPSAYECAIEVEDTDNFNRKAKIISNLPANIIKTSQVSNTMGYSVGGSVGFEGKTPSAEINASYNYTQSINYDQPNFVTINTDSSINKAKWDVTFSSTDEGYDKDSHNITYGNQMFMKSRLYNEGSKNLVSIDKLPALISGGFSPDFLVVLNAPKDKKVSIVKISFSRNMDKYYLKWTGFNWFGYNFFRNKTLSSGKFLIDWQSRTVTPLIK